MSSSKFRLESIMKPNYHYLALLLTVVVGSIFAVVPVAFTVVRAEDSMRINVLVPPREIGTRVKNELPAEFRITADDLPPNRRLDPASLEVYAWKADQPLGKPLPIRWYDDAIPYSFPDCEQNVSATDVRSFLRYYENVSTDAEPHLVERPFPQHGDLPNGSLATPRAVDLDGDGLFDLAISANENLYIYFNVGQPHKPMFAVYVQPLVSEWGSAPLPNWGVQYIDWDSDGRPDIIGSSANGKVWSWRCLGDGKFSDPLPIPMPEVCYSPFATVVDWNGDSDLDLLVGTAYGYTCWFERSFLEHGYAVAERLKEKKH